MPSKSHSSRSTKRHTSSKTRAGARHTTPVAMSETTDGVPADEDESDDQMTPQGGKAAVQAPSADQEMPSSPQTPIAGTRRQMAGLALNGEKREKKKLNLKFEDVEQIETRFEDLRDSGWRPEEELGSIGDDDDYGGLESISESDDDEAAVRRHEVQNMVSRQDARRLSLQSDDLENEWNGFDDVGLGADAERLGCIFDLQDQPASFILAEEQENAASRESRRGINSHKAVRFDVDSSGSERSPDEDDICDDDYLFGPEKQTFLPAGNTNNEITTKEEGSDAGSEWDYDEIEMNDDAGDSGDESSDDSADSSGYDSDEEDLTDEEMPVALPIRSQPASKESSPVQIQPQTPAKSPALTQGSVSTVKTKAKKTPVPASTPRLPTLGTFQIDPRRPMMIASGAGGQQRNTLVAPKIQTNDQRKFWQRMKNSYAGRPRTPRTSVHVELGEDEMSLDGDGPLFGPNSPFPSLRNASLTESFIGSPEELTSHSMFDAAGAMVADTPMLFGSEDEDEQDDLTAMSPFVNWDKIEQDMDQEMDDDSQEPSDETTYGLRRRANTMPEPASPPSNVTTPSLSRRDTLNSAFDNDLLSHLDRNSSLVHAFRMNQNYVKRVASHAAHPSTRAQTSEMNAMQAGRRKWGNTPITPMRKKRGGSLNKIGKVDWSKGLLGDTTPSGKATGGGLKRPVSAGGMGKREKRSSLFL